jgi:hypothetical protein
MEIVIDGGVYVWSWISEHGIKAEKRDIVKECDANEGE